MSTAPRQQPIQKTSRRWQFSLRGLLVAVTAFCVVLATFGANWWFLIYVGLSAGALLGVLALDSYLIFNSTLPSRRTMNGGAVACLGIGLLWTFEAVEFQSIDRLLWAMIPISGPLFWLTPWCLWRVLRRVPAEFSYTQVRRAATINLVFFAATYTIASFLNELVPGKPFHGDPAVVVAVLAGLVMALPWIKLLRWRAMRNRPAWSFFEYVSLVCLLGGLATIALWFVLGHYVVMKSDLPRMGLAMAIWLTLLFVCLVPAGSIVFAVGCLIELWRDRWHRWLTGVGGIFFVAFWIWLALDNNAPFTLFEIRNHP